MFNKAGAPVGKITDMEVTQMHPSAQRLYQAAKELRGVIGQSAVARLLNQSPQTVKNWETRGVSLRAALQAQKVIGCRASWVLDGDGSMPMSGQNTKLPSLSGGGQGGSPTSAANELLRAVLVIGERLLAADDIARDQARPLLLALTRDPDRAVEIGRRLLATLTQGNGGPGTALRSGTAG